MNREISYIVHAFLLLLFLPVLFFAIKFILSQPDTKENDRIIDYVDIKAQNPPSEIFTTGQSLFRSKCASCHVLFMDMTGPDLIGFENRGPWVERKNLYQWVKNPSAFIQKNEYAKELQKRFKTTMTAFPDLSDGEIDAICEYITQAK